MNLVVDKAPGRPRAPLIREVVLGAVSSVVHPYGVIKFASICVVGRTVVRLLRSFKGSRHPTHPCTAADGQEPAEEERPLIASRDQWLPTNRPAPQLDSNYKEVLRVELPCSPYVFYDKFLSSNSGFLKVRCSVQASELMRRLPIYQHEA